jgi:hypothetical protein
MADARTEALEGRGTSVVVAKWRSAKRLVAGIGGGVIGGGLILLSVAVPASAGAPSSTAQAKAHLLTLSAMPRGWVVEKGTASSGGGMWGGSDGLKGLDQLAACIGVPTSIIADNLPGSTGPYYRNKDDSLEVQDSVSVFASTGAARTQLASLANPKTPGCMADFMNGVGKTQYQKGIGKDATIGTIVVTPLTAQAFGRGVVGMVMRLPITYKGVTVNSQLIFANAIKGRLGQSLSYNSYGRTFPSSLAKRLDSAALSHL